MVRVIRVSYSNINDIRGTLAYWFANTACQILLGQRECDVAGEAYDFLPTIASRLEAIKDELLGIKAEHVFQEIKVTNKYRISVGDAISILTSTSPREEFFYAPSHLFIEYGEFLEGFLNTDIYKRDKIFISNIVISLALVGAAMAYSYTVSRGGVNVHGYIGYTGVSMIKGEALNRYRALRKSSNVIRILAMNEAPWETVELAVASILVRDDLKPAEWDTFEVVEAYRGTSKINIASYRVSHISTLASVISREFAEGFLELVNRYGRDKSVKKLADHIARNIYLYSLYRDPQYMYQALRPLMSKGIDERFQEVIAGWGDIANKMLGIAGWWAGE
ncbi:hypothetical protein ATG_05870 [Desulfurococcaceae archaeon AG1]|nr:hypothetical protein ATG_05870 [Desulfurococcaceae archaeon AG1]